MTKRLTDPAGIEFMALEQHDLEAWTNKIGLRLILGGGFIALSIFFAVVVWYATVNQTLRDQQRQITEIRVRGSDPTLMLRDEIDSLRIELRHLPERIGRQVEKSTN